MHVAVFSLIKVVWRDKAVFVNEYTSGYNVTSSFTSFCYLPSQSHPNTTCQCSAHAVAWPLEWVLILWTIPTTSLKKIRIPVMIMYTNPHWRILMLHPFIDQSSVATNIDKLVKDILSHQIHFEDITSFLNGWYNPFMLSLDLNFSYIVEPL